MQSAKHKIGKKKIVRYVFAAAFCLLMIVCVIMLLDNATDIHRLNTQASEYNEQYEQQVRENEEIKDILNSDDKDDYIEQKAREKGYVKEGETVYYDISSSK